MSWEIEYMDDFEKWWNRLSEAEQESVAASVGLLEQFGPRLPFPHSSGIERSKHGHISGATKRGTIAGMSNLYRWRTDFTMRT